MSTRTWIPKLLLSAVPALLVPSHALGNSLTLTSQGVADGFTLSNFATTNPGYVGCCSGPFGVAVTSGGNILVSTGAGRTYLFNDSDGQTTGSALSSRASNSGTNAYATIGGQAYGTQNGRYVEFTAAGTVDHVLTGVTASPYLGMWGNPANGHILAASYSGIIDIDPLANGGAGSFRLVNTVLPDGVTVSADGLTVYAEVGGQIIGYSIATGAQTFASGNLPGLSGADGSGIISSANSLNGDIVINFNGNGVNSGGIGLLDPTTHMFTILATGGTRGDYVSPDTNNGTLFLDFSDTVERLSCGPDCSIGGVLPQPNPSAIPEPGTFALLGTGLSLLTAAVRRQRSKA